MLCDCHIHFIPQELSVHTAFYKGVWTDKDKLYDFLEKNNIDRALLVYPSTDAHLKLGSLGKACDFYNEAAACVISENKKIIAAGLINLDNPADIASQVKELKNKGFGAISIASSHNGKFITGELEPLFAAAQECGLAIFVHPQTINPIGFERVKDPLLMPVLEYSMDSSMFLGLLMMEGLLERFDVKFIFSSLGGVIPFLKERFDRVYTMLRARSIVKDLGKLPSEILKRVYVDTSGASLKNIELAVDLFGEDKILWGSDYPVSGDVAKNLAMLDDLGAKVKSKITAENFLKVFK